MARSAFGGRDTSESFDRRAPLVPRGPSFRWSILLVVVEVRRRAVQLPQCAQNRMSFLIYQVQGWGAIRWKPIEQRVPITWTVCQLGGRRPWFTCSVYFNG